MNKVTYSIKRDDSEKKWLLIDAENKVLGRLAAKIATILRGKDNPAFTPNYDSGNFVVVINAGRVKLTGKKMENKDYHYHTFYPGGLKTIKVSEMFEKHPEDVLYRAVKGMLPKNRLGRTLIKKLKIYAGSEHPHKSQKPIKIEA
jgi:large subunit ribosomal protein L13